MENDIVSDTPPQDQPFGNVSKSSRTPECPCGCHFSDFDYRGGKDCAMCGDNHTPFAATKGTPTEIVEELRGNPPHQEQESDLHRHFYKCIGCDASIGSIEEHVRNLQALDKAALALSSADSSGSDNVPLPSGSGEQPTSVEPTLKEKVVALNKGLCNYYARDDVFAGFGVVTAVEHNRAIQNLVAEERRQAKEEVYDAIKDMEGAYPDAGRTLSKGDIIKWLEYELGIGRGRNG